MFWYVVPVVENADGGLCPAVNGVPVDLPQASRLHVKRTDPIPTTALLGCTGELVSIPPGWASKTLAEAKVDFTSRFGAASAAAEVF